MESIPRFYLFFSVVMVPLISASEISDVVISGSCCVTTALRPSGMSVLPRSTLSTSSVPSFKESSSLMIIIIIITIIQTYLYRIAASVLRRILLSMQVLLKIKKINENKRSSQYSRIVT